MLLPIEVWKRYSALWNTNIFTIIDVFDYQNTHFLKQFGRNDFKDIATQDDISEAAKYITKYMEKSGERLVYGGKLPTYFRSDVLDEDVICTFGIDDRKVLLFDNFTCINEGEILGKVSKEIIAQLPHCN